MTTPSLFYQPRIQKIKFSSIVQCAQSDKPKMIALEEARNAYIDQAQSSRFNPEKRLEAAQHYLPLLLSYAEFCDKVNADYSDQSDVIYKKDLLYDHKSLFNGKPAVFTQSRMENYMVLFQMVATRIDMQFQVTQANAAPDVLRVQNQYLKEALGILDELKSLSRCIVVLDEDPRKVALELRLELVDWVTHIVKGFFCVNALDQGLGMNRAAEKDDEPPRYDAMCLAGLAKTAEMHFKRAESELDTAFRQDSLNPNLVQFVRSMRLVAQMLKLAMYYRHFYDISVDIDTKDAEVERADAQKYLIGSMMKKLLAETEKIRIKASGVDNWFGERFDEHAQAFKRIAERGREVSAALQDTANTVQVQSVPYTRPEPLWTDLNIPGLREVKKKLPEPAKADDVGKTVEKGPDKNVPTIPGIDE